MKHSDTASTSDTSQTGWTLVFPSSMPASIQYSLKARGQGDKILGSSSSNIDDTTEYYDKWIYLPSIYDKEFKDHFLAIVRSHNITSFFTAHPLVYDSVKKIVDKLCPNVKITRQSPIETLNNQYKSVLKRADSSLKFIHNIDSRCNVSEIFIASILHHAGQIYGQTSEVKISAIIAILNSAVKGDVIEIGSAWGRSAFVLANLARYYDIGNVLFIDPWDEEIALQNESSKQLNELNPALNWELMYQIFKINMVSYNYGNFNYIRKTSEDALKLYSSSSLVKSEEFGNTSFSKTISLLHIDGNHDYKNVLKDYLLWRPYLAPGGWLILDDYVLEYGGGPKRVGDLILEKESNSIDKCFTAGNALFIHFKK